MDFHRLGYSSKSVPAVNVKIYKGIDSIALPREEFNPLFTHAWIEQNVKDVDDYWSDARQYGWEELETIAHEVYGDDSLEVLDEGR